MEFTLLWGVPIEYTAQSFLDVWSAYVGKKIGTDLKTRMTESPILAKPLPTRIDLAPKASTKNFKGIVAWLAIRNKEQTNKQPEVITQENTPVTIANLTRGIQSLFLEPLSNYDFLNVV